MTSDITLEKDLIICHDDAKTKEEVIQRLSGIMLKKGYVKESYVNAVLTREERFPTGLKTGKYNIAIPHTDPEHVNRQSVAIMTLKDEAVFHRMDDFDDEVGVKVVILLALNDGHRHLEMLAKLIRMCGKDEFVEQLIQAGNQEDVLAVMNRELKGE
ncbi:MAG: PTS sugar transporter subunit IIA [Dorea sp.]|nr:PTS sugar transporter subunit IIA [Dorea sp.]